MRILGLDLGRKRIGVAISDPLGAFARELCTLERTSKGKVFSALKELVREWQVGLVVAGLPRKLSGEKGDEARWAESFARELEEALAVPVAVWDERLSTVQAARELKAGGRRTARQDLDARAAAVMLQSYLDAKRWEGSGADAEKEV